MIGEPPPFFHRGPSPLARVTFFALVAIGIMIADHRFQALEALRLSLSVLAHPVQKVASFPGEAFGRVGAYFADQDRLLEENRSLKAKLLDQAASAQQAALLRAEQDHLLRMQAGKSRFNTQGVVTEVLYSARNPFTRKVVVDKGLTQGMRAGMPAIDGEGVVGQVTAVGTFTSEVTLLTEKGQSVPVMLVRNGLRAIAVGSGKDGTLEVPFMPASADIQNGDVFVTSGIDGTYPPGLAVAKVTSVEKNAAFVFARIVALPTAGIQNFRFVMLLPVPEAAPPPPEAKAEDRKGARGAAPKARRP